MGYATGFQSGVALGKAFREGQERRRLEGIRTAAPEVSQGYTAEQGQQLEAMASAINPETGRPYYNVQVNESGNYTVTPDFTEAQIPRTGMGTDVVGIDRTQLQPAAFNQQRVTNFLGRRFEGELTPDRIEALRSRAMAEGISDPRTRQAALAEATRAEREAEEAPLRRRALETQVAAGELGLTRTQQEIERGGIELTAAQRTAAAAKRMDDFNTWRSQNPDADFAAINAEVQRLGMGVEEQFKVASNLTGISEQAFKASQQRIRKLTENQGLDGLLNAHKESNDLDPGSHFEVTRGKDGRVSLNRVNTATGAVIQPNVFSGSEAEATAYLNRAAMDPATIIDFTMNLEKNRAAIERDRASAEKDRNLGQRYLRDGETEKGLAKKVSDVETSLGRKLTESEKLTLFGLGPRPTQGPARELSDVDKENLREYRRWEADPRNAKLPQGQKDKKAMELGVTEFVNRAAAGPTSGLGSNPFAVPQPGAAPAAGEPTQLSLPPSATPRAGLVTPAQAAAAQTTQARQTAAQAQQDTEAGIRAQGLARQNYILRQEAASLTPAVIGQLTRTQAVEARRTYDQFLTPEQRRELNRRM
jgi:hypothetical protein